jgi:hypothetical protein
VLLVETVNSCEASLSVFLIKRLRDQVVAFAEVSTALKEALSCSFQERKRHQPKPAKEKTMKKLKALGATASLMVVLVLPALAGQTSTPPCGEPEPGQTSTPPCAAAPGDIGTPGVDSTAPADLGTVANGDTSFADFAADLLLNLLPLY